MCEQQTPVCYQPTTSPSGSGYKPPIPVVTCCGAGEPYPNWLRRFLGDQFGSEADLNLALAVATGEVTFVELGERLTMDRRTAKRWWNQTLGRLSEGWLSRLSATLLAGFLRTGRVAGIKPFTLQAVAVPAAVCVLPSCERSFAGVPTVGELTAFCDEVRTTLFGRRGAILALRCDEAGNTTAAVVVAVGIGNAGARDLDDDRFALAA